MTAAVLLPEASTRSSVKAVKEKKDQVSQNNPIQIVSSNVQSLRRYAALGEKRFVMRALRSVHLLRKQLTEALLQESIVAFVRSEDPIWSFLSSHLPSIHDAMVTNTSGSGDLFEESTVASQSLVTLYLGLLLLLFYLDKREYEKAKALSSGWVEFIQKSNLRVLDPIASLIYFYYYRSHELTNCASSLRPILLQAYKSRCLRGDVDSQAVLLNLLVRSYVDDKLYDQAELLISKVKFPETADNYQVARYMYYLGRIKAVQLDYSASYQHLSHAIRKAPQGARAAGFQQTVHKLAVIVQLLTGEIPDRSLFRQTVLAMSLRPYFHLTQAIRKGDLDLFNEIQHKYSDVFQKDQNFTLVMRLRHNVIKTGVRLISKAYSRISFADICRKLNVGSPEDAEFIVAKTIKDGVIDATVDSDARAMQSKEVVDVYSTSEPQSSYFQRTKFCVAMYDESVQAMRYPDHLHRRDWKSSRHQHLNLKELESTAGDGDDVDFI